MLCGLLSWLRSLFRRSQWRRAALNPPKEREAKASRGSLRSFLHSASFISSSTINSSTKLNEIDWVDWKKLNLLNGNGSLTLRENVFIPLSFHSIHSLGRLAPQIQIKSILLFPFSKRKEDWLIDLNFAAGIKVSWINQKFIHWFHKNKLKFIFISSIPFTFALFTSTFIPLYCYNTFWLRQLNKLTKSKWNSINFIGWMEWRWVDLLMAAAPIKENKFSFNLRVMGYEFGPQSSTQSHLSSHSTFNCLCWPSVFAGANEAKPREPQWNESYFHEMEWYRGDGPPAYNPLYSLLMGQHQQAKQRQST